MSKDIKIKSIEDIEKLRISNLIVSETLALVGSILKPGITGIELDRKAEEFIRDNGGKPSFKGYSGYPASLCISINEAVVHGIPSKYEIKETDIVSVDCGVYKNGFHGDSAYTFALADVNEVTMKLLRDTNYSLYLGIEKAVAGNRIGDIGPCNSGIY
ncbi:MAG: M24 family metallopeptidase [Saprospiraceae bacterium]